MCAGRRTDNCVFTQADRDVEAFFKKKIVRKLVITIWFKRAIENKFMGKGITERERKEAAPAGWFQKD